MTSPLRLMMTVDAIGGVWHYSVELCSALARSGVEIVLACLGPSPNASQRGCIASLANVKLVDTELALDWLAPDAAAIAATGKALADLATSEAVALVHCNQPAFVTTDFAVPVVAVIHSCVATWWDAVRGGTLPHTFRWQSECVARGLGQADVIAAPSQAFAMAVQRRYGLAHCPLVVSNGRTPLAEANKPGEIFALTAGRLWDDGKGMATLDRVAAGLSRPLRAAGPTSGPAGETVVLRHAEAIGPIDSVALGAQFASRPVFISAARYEPFGLAVLEAAQSRCPLVLSDIPTFRETWNDAAQFVDGGDVDGFIRVTEDLFGAPAKREAWGRRACERAARFTPKRMAGEMMAIYDRLVIPRASEQRTAAA